MVKAGKPVDEFIEQLIPLLSPGDIIIDGGNSHFPDTNRRTQYVESKGLLYMVPAFRVVKKVLCLAHQLCPEDHLLHGQQ